MGPAADTAPDPLARVRALIEAESTSAPAPAPGETRARLHLLCTALERAVPADGAGMTIAVTGDPALVLAASGSVAEQLEELQITLGEGPCVDAVRSRRPVLEPDLAGAGALRWPGYAAEATALGVGAVFAFPLQSGAVCLGGLDVYRQRPGSLSRSGTGDALAFAEVAFDIVLDDGSPSHGSPAEGDPEQLIASGVLYQAQGMLMVQLDVSLAEAMVRIRAHAYAQDRRLGAVARDIVDGILLLSKG